MSMHEMYSLYCGVPTRNSLDLRGNWLDIILLMLDLDRERESFEIEGGEGRREAQLHDEMLT